MIGIELQELVLELIATPDIERDDVIGKAALFEQDGDFLAVGRWPVIEINHWARPSLLAPEYGGTRSRSHPAAFAKESRMRVARRPIWPLSSDAHLTVNERSGSAEVFT
jgi:hypothetical protein